MPFQGLYSLSCSYSPSQCFQLSEVSNRLMKTWKAPYRYKVLCCRSSMAITISGNVWEWLYCWTVFNLVSNAVQILGEEGKAFSVFSGSAHMPIGVFTSESVHVNTYLCWEDWLVTGSTFRCKNPTMQEERFQSHLKCLQKVEPREPF